MPSSILAATVVFTGIICHAQLDLSKTERTALLVDVDAKHISQIEIKESDVDNVHTTMTLPTPMGHMYFVPLKNHQLIIHPGDASGPVSPSPHFDSDVPHLPKIVYAGGTPPALHHDILSGRLHNMRASIKYTTGTLSVASCYEDRQKFPQPATQGTMCVARFINLKFNTTTTWEIEDLNTNKKIVLAKDAVVVVSDSNDDPTAFGHYLHHADLLETGTVVPWTSAGKCNTSTCMAMLTPAHPTGAHPAHGANVDCSSTQWP